MAGYISAWEIAWVRTKNPHYQQLCRFWTKIFALAFGIGVVSGIVLSYEFGTNFGRFSEATGNVIGPLLSYEVLTAFFLESGFLGIMLFGQNKVSPAVHLFSSLMVTLGTIFSAFWVISANSWMHTPQGYHMENGIFFVDDWLKVIFNPSFPYRLLHMLVAAYLSTTFLISGIAAWYLAHGKHMKIAQSVFSFTFWVMLVLTPLQLFLGDAHGLNTLQYEPIKIAAMEGRWETMREAPLTLFAIPDNENETNHFAVEIPKLGSIILRHDREGEIEGLKAVPKEDRPYVPIVFYSFRVMVGLGMGMILTAFFGLFLRMRGKLYSNQYFLKWCTVFSPAGFIAILAGWFVTETGRQPWLVHGLMRTSDGASVLPPGSVLTSLIIFIVLYGAMFTAFILYLLRLIKGGITEITKEETPDHLTNWLEKTPDA